MRRRANTPSATPRRTEHRPSEEAWATGWRWAKALYSMLGWIVPSLAIVTATGVIKRQSGG